MDRKPYPGWFCLGRRYFGRRYFGRRYFGQRYPGGRFLGAVLLAAFALAARLEAQTTAEPDISGIWQAYASVAAPGTGQARSLTPEGAERVEAFFSQYGDDMPEPGWYCVPPGLPASMISTVSYPVEIIQSPGRVTMIHELDMQLRRIFLDGRDFPPENYWKTRMGYSIGHWEGETLVI
jgi:hypothetical protein